MAMLSNTFRGRGRGYPLFFLAGRMLANAPTDPSEEELDAAVAMAVRFLCAWPRRMLIMRREHGVDLDLFDPNSPAQANALKDQVDAAMQEIRWAQVSVVGLEVDQAEGSRTVRLAYVPRGTPRAFGQPQARGLDVTL
jgi:hypothetical protein